MHLDSTLCLGKINVYRKTIIAQSSVVSSTEKAALEKAALDPLEKAALDPARKTTNPTVKIATTLDPVVTATKRMGGRLGGSGKQGAAPDLARRRSDVDDR